MFKFFKDFYCDEEGMGTVEIVIIIAVLVALAITFKNQITNFATSLMDKFFNADSGNFSDLEQLSDTEISE